MVFQVTWTAPASPNQPIVGYELLRNGAAVFTGMATSFTDGGLNPSTAYAYILIANNGFDSSQSQPVVVKTLEDSPARIPAPVLTSLSFSSIGATWTIPEIPNGEVVSYALLQGSDNQAVCKGPTIFACTVAGLDTFAVYSFRVEACTIRGCGFSPRVEIRTMPSAPAEMAAPEATMEGLSTLLRWSPPVFPNGVIRNYSVWVSGEFANNSYGGEITLPCVCGPGASLAQRSFAGRSLWT